MATVNVTPGVLSWAREQVAMSQQEAAEKLGVQVERLARWEEGDEDPTATAVNAMARVYKRPLALFFMEKPPRTQALPEDYRLRTVGGMPAESSRELIVPIRQARAWQSIIARLAKHDETLVQATRVPLVRLDQDPEAVASETRGLLNVSHDEQLGWRGAEEGLAIWRERVESLGVLVFAMRLDREACRGFSMWMDPGPPLIALARESDQARIFTLMHELAHLMLRTGGICSEFEDESERGLVERFCNRVAAGVLMPQALIAPVVRSLFRDVTRYWSYGDVDLVARTLRVSIPATALRLEKLGMAQEGLYQDIVSRPAPQIERRRGGGGGSRSWPGVRIAERGTNYSKAVFDAWSRRSITIADAARAMNMRARYVPRIGEAVIRRRERLA